MIENILRKVAPYFSVLSLVVILFFAAQVFAGKQDIKTYILWTNISTVVWFVFSPFWLVKRNKTV